jgi:hypothetical protein
MLPWQWPRRRRQRTNTRRDADLVLLPLLRLPMPDLDEVGARAEPSFRLFWWQWSVPPTALPRPSRVERSCPVHQTKIS